ncbi:MAG: UPF0182 family protein [Dehalococcoidia bacterium]|nr:UPF0182 family protein [Dehalococcoidia bacterium]|tara:strand:+ start:36719 stop:39523 length:2805 start_codon:yes stop_codon:yes gene_type:complete
MKLGFFDNRERGGDNTPPPFDLNTSRNTQFPIPNRILVIGVVGLILLIVLSVLKGFYVDLLWFDSVGYDSVFWKSITAKTLLFLVGLFISILVLGTNIWLARKLSPQGPEQSFIEEIDVSALRKVVSVILIAATLLLAVIFGSVAGSSWQTILAWINGIDFAGRTDPQFGRNISFYMFQLPAYQMIQGWFLSLIVMSVLGSVAVYGLSISLQGFQLQITRGMRIHLSVLVGLIFILISIGTYLSIFELVLSEGGIIFGATYTDINAVLPARYVVVALALFAGLVTIANGFLSNNGYKLPLFAFSIWVIAGIVGGAIYPNFVQSFQVAPNEREREVSYIQRNIEATRYAYGLDEITNNDFPAEQSVTIEAIEANPKTLDNIRLLDPRPLRDTFNQVQAIRQFYEFTDVDVDRYVVNGEPRQVMLSARELDISGAQQRNWTQERLQLTHGFGAVVAPVNKVIDEGLPDFITKDIPPASEEIELSIEGSRLYFGEITDQYVIVNSNEVEFDYPLGEGNAETSYEADRGIKLSSFGRKLALAWDLGDTNILISSQINSDSRLLLHRNIKDRISQVAPFLILDRDPYIVIIDGQLKWIQSAYTTSNRYPYSQPRGNVNYIRDSVKIVVDAVTGDMTFYLIDEEDPVAGTWAKIFPDLFTPNASMPSSIRDHLRYPLDMFSLQSNLYLRYHITDPNVFFIGEDFWNIPTERFFQQEQPVEPYYVLMTLPQVEKVDNVTQENLEFSLIMPFTPRNRQNTVAWLAGRSDGADYGSLVAYRFPTDDLVFGPAQIEARIDQNPGISQQITLWDQAGSEVIRGNLLMIPIGQSFLFVEPIYLQADTSRLPELVRVVVANGNAIAMERTFEEALDVVLGRTSSSLPEDNVIGGISSDNSQKETSDIKPVSGDTNQLIEQARESLEDVESELSKLKRVIDALENSTQ